MMITLVLLLIALVFFMWPAFSRRSKKISREAENLRLYKQRKDEIFLTEYSEEEREQMLLELDRDLIENDADVGAFKDASFRKKTLTAFALFILMVSSVLYLYQNFGATDELMATQLLNKMSQGELNDEEQALLKKSLRNASESNPDNQEWAYLYARMLSTDGQYEESIATFEKILARLPEEAMADRSAALVQIAQAKFYLADQKASDAIYNDLKEAITTDPSNSQALGMAGIMAFELGYLEDAFTHWKALWFNMSTRPEVASLEQGIRRIAAELEAQGKEVDLSWMTHAEVKVFVSISDELKSQLRDTDLVFVVAKAITGPVMPLAAVRITVADLPLEVVLDDSLGMMPGLSLSKFDEVQVIARVAKSGGPIAKPGDLQGKINSVLVKSNDTIDLVINTVVE